MNNIILKPCPLCNGEASIELDGARIGTSRQSCIVVCLDCGCSVESNETENRCGTIWNTREHESVEKLKLLNSLLTAVIEKIQIENSISKVSAYREIELLIANMINDKELL